VCRLRAIEMSAVHGKPSDIHDEGDRFVEAVGGWAGWVMAVVKSAGVFCLTSPGYECVAPLNAFEDSRDPSPASPAFQTAVGTHASDGHAPAACSAGLDPRPCSAADSKCIEKPKISISR